MVIVDNSVLSSLANINELNFLVNLFDELIVSELVLNEFKLKWKNISLGNQFAIHKKVDNLPEFVIRHPNLTKLSPADQEVIYWSLKYNGPVITDDAKIRSFCKNNDILVFGTVAVVKRNYQRGFIDSYDKYKDIILELSIDLYLSKELIAWALKI